MAVDIEQLLSDPQRVSVVATCDTEGLPNLAVISCVRPQPDGSWLLGLGANHTLANLRATGKAALLLCRPGTSLPLWQGVRLQLEATDFCSDGPLFKELVAGVTAEAGRRAGRAIRCAVTCRVTGERPLIDLFTLPSPPAA